MEGLLPMLASCAALGIFVYVLFSLPTADDEKKERAKSHD